MKVEEHPGAGVEHEEEVEEDIDDLLDSLEGER
jgi:hypothetical protein